MRTSGVMGECTTVAGFYPVLDHGRHSNRGQTARHSRTISPKFTDRAADDDRTNEPKEKYADQSASTT